MVLVIYLQNTKSLRVNMQYQIQDLLAQMVEMGGSDLHITAGSPPLVRKDGVLKPLGESKLTPDETHQLAYSVMNEEQRKIFEQNRECDFSFGFRNVCRFRANSFVQRGCVALVLRAIPVEIKTMAELNLPEVLEKYCDLPSGLVLVCGATGSGKSTTLAAMIDRINESRDEHIITIEDPIEFLHKHKRCLVNQREIHNDTGSFDHALRAALRQDPDVVLIGEMRDLETMKAALAIAETGHLTFATLHTNSAVQSIGRIVDSFPANEQQTIRAQLAFVLQGIFCQSLLPKIGGGRALCFEIMTCTPGIRAQIRDDKTHQIESSIEAGSRFGMITRNKKLQQLVHSGLISRDTAVNASLNPEQLEKLLMEY